MNTQALEQQATDAFITEMLLPRDEYYAVEQKKRQIVLHHTAGSHRPDWTINGWKSDRLGRVATAYVIGSIATDGNADWNGRILGTMNPSHWAHHIGLKTDANERLNKASIGIELCCYGQLTKHRDGTFWSYVNRPVPSEQVVDLGFEFRGYRYWHSYTDAQIESLRKLLVQLSEQFQIPVSRKWGVKDFRISAEALSGTSGVFTHCQYREDKFDCYPHPKLLEMLNSL